MADPKEDICSLVKMQIRESRAQFFMSQASIRVRIAEDYKKQPELIEADLAYTVMTALSAAAVAEVPLDIDKAIEAGKQLYAADFPPDLPS